MEEVQLRVEKAYPIDLGRGIIRLDPTALLTLHLSPGDSVEIIGKKKTTAKVWRADRQDWELGITRIDNFIRQSAGVSIGGTVTIKKVSPQKAKKLVLELPESTTQGGPEVKFDENANEIIKRHILKRSIICGDIVPIIISKSESESSTELTEPPIQSQLISLVAISTTPSDVVVQVFEETEVKLLDKAAQRKTTISKFDNSQAKSEISKVQNSSSSFDFDTIAAQLELMQAKLDAIKNPNIDTVTSFVSDKKDEDISIIILSENIIKTKAHYEEIGNSIEKYNIDYIVEASRTQSLLKDVINKSDNVVYEYIYNLKFQDAFNYIKDLDSKLELYHKVALSEIAHRKMKEIEIQMNSPFFTSKLRKNHKKLVSEFDKLDTDGIQGTKGNNEFIETAKELMEKLQEMEEGVVEEQKTGIRSSLKTLVFWGIPVLFSFYSLVADDYFKVSFYTPIAFYVVLSIITYLFLKSGVNLNIIYWGYKSHLLGVKKSNAFAFILAIASLIVGFTDFGSASPATTSTISLFTTFLGILLAIICISSIFLLKDYVKYIKQKLIEKEVDNLIGKYGFDTSIIS